MVTESTGAPQRKSHYLLEISSMGVLYHDVPLCLSCHLKKKKTCFSYLFCNHHNSVLFVHQSKF